MLLTNTITAITCPKFCRKNKEIKILLFLPNIPYFSFLVENFKEKCCFSWTSKENFNLSITACYNFVIYLSFVRSSLRTAIYIQYSWNIKSPYTHFHGISLGTYLENSFLVFYNSFWCWIWFSNACIIWFKTENTFYPLSSYKLCIQSMCIHLMKCAITKRRGRNGNIGRFL